MTSNTHLFDIYHQCSQRHKYMWMCYRHQRRLLRLDIDWEHSHWYLRKTHNKKMSLYHLEEKRNSCGKGENNSFHLWLLWWCDNYLLISQSFPVKPGLQLHVKSLTRSQQHVPPFLHGSGKQSLISKKIYKQKKLVRKEYYGADTRSDFLCDVSCDVANDEIAPCEHQCDVAKNHRVITTSEGRIQLFKKRLNTE